MAHARRAFVLIASLCLATSSIASTLLEEDLVPGSGDGLITIDMAAGLEWLDLTVTQNQSYASIAAGAGGWTTANGFR